MAYAFGFFALAFVYCIFCIPALGLMWGLMFSLRRVGVSEFERRVLFVVLAVLAFTPSLAPGALSIVVVPHWATLVFGLMDVAWYREYWQWYVASFVITFFVMLFVQARIFRKPQSVS